MLIVQNGKDIQELPFFQKQNLFFLINIFFLTNSFQHNHIINHIQDLIQFLERNGFTIGKIKETNDMSGTFFASHK